MGFADRTPPIEIKRICLNPECSSNTGDTALTEAV